MLVSSLIRDVACDLSNEAPEDPILAKHVQDALLSQGEVDQSTWPTQSRLWYREQELMPGMWTMPSEYGILPRMRILEGWNPNLEHAVPPFHPTCLSTRSTDPRFNLTPTANYDWDAWTHEDYPDKPYLIARKPGAQVSFELETNVGWIKMYSLRSRSFGLGTVKCWVDDALDRAVKVEGWWDNDS